MARRWFLWLLAGWWMCAGVCAAENPAPDASVGAALRSLAARASDVFIGQVVSITRKGGVVEIAFHVEESIAGSQGGVYTLREWAGLWPPGMHRYTLGQRAMVFVHAPGAAGLTTPVDGPDGVVPVVAESAAAAPLLDVRRLAARVQRSTTTPLEESAVTVALSDAETLVKTYRNPVWREPHRLPLPVHLRSLPTPVRGRLVTVPLLTVDEPEARDVR